MAESVQNVVRMTRSPQRVRQALERRGPTFVKLGQFLATRPDFIPQEYCDEFIRLTDNVPPFPGVQARQVVEENLGKPLAECFAWFDDEPFAAGSLAQVHAARTLAGDEVIVKVQRPGVEETIRRDLGRPRSLTRIFGLIGVAPPEPIEEILSELANWLTQELNLQTELNNLRRLRAAAKRSATWYVPRVYAELSGTKVLTTELLKGVPFSHLLRLERREQDRFAELEFDRDALSANVCDAVLEQMFRHRFFHADIHAGNLIALEGNRVGFVDAALAAGVDSTLRIDMTRFLRAIADDDLEGMLRSLTDLLTESEDTDIERFQRRFVELTRTWLHERDRPPEQGQDGRASLRSYMVDLLRAARENGYKIPPRLLALYRSLLGAETLAIQLNSPHDIARRGRRFFRAQQFEQAFKGMQLEDLTQNALQVIELLRNAPARLDNLLDRLANDSFVIRVRQSESAHAREQSNIRARLVSASILAVAVAVLFSGVARDAAVFRVSVRWLLAGAGAAIVGRIAFLWRALR